jgi:hypothetical protein
MHETLRVQLTMSPCPDELRRIQKQWQYDYTSQIFTALSPILAMGLPGTQTCVMLLCGAYHGRPKETSG